MSDELQCSKCGLVSDRERRSLADDPQALRLWFGEHIWAADDFGGVDDGTLTQLFDLIEPEWRKFTWEGKRAAEGEQTDE